MWNLKSQIWIAKHKYGLKATNVDEKSQMWIESHNCRLKVTNMDQNHKYK